jgi:hypothetical protein
MFLGATNRRRIILICIVYRYSLLLAHKNYVNEINKLAHKFDCKQKGL